MYVARNSCSFLKRVEMHFFPSNSNVKREFIASAGEEEKKESLSGIFPFDSERAGGFFVRPRRAAKKSDLAPPSYLFAIRV